MQDLNNSEVNNNEEVTPVENVGTPTTADENEIPHTDEAPVKEEEPAQDEQAQDEVMIKGREFHGAFMYETPYGVVGAFEDELPQSTIDSIVARLKEQKQDFEQVFGEGTFEMSEPTEESVKHMFEQKNAQEAAMVEELADMLAKLFTPPVLNKRQEKLVDLLGAMSKGVLSVAGAMNEQSFKPQAGATSEANKIVRDAFLSLQEDMELLYMSYEHMLNRRKDAAKQQKFLDKINAKFTK